MVRESEKGPAGITERDGVVREVPELENQRKERTVEAGCEVEDHLTRSHDHRKQTVESPRSRRTVSIATDPSLTACRGLPFATTDFKISIQCSAATLDVSGIT